MKAQQKRSARRGFSLIEVAVATAIVGFALTALMVAAASNTRVNDAGRKITQAIFLAQEIREWTLALPFSDQDPADQGKPPGPDGSDPQVFVDDLDDLMFVTFSPPRDGQGLPVNELPGWSQAIGLSWRDPADLTTEVASGSSDVIYVMVTVAFNGETILTTSWLRTRRADE